MELNLRVANRQGRASPCEVRLCLGSEGITIGRGLTNDLCLDDPDRVVSGGHARIELRDGGIWITDTSRNGTYLNNAAEPIPPHQSVALYDGDRLGIGPYDVVVGFGGEPGLPGEEISDPVSDEGYEALSDLAPDPAADILDLLDSDDVRTGARPADVPPEPRGASGQPATGQAEPPAGPLCQETERVDLVQEVPHAPAPPLRRSEPPRRSVASATPPEGREMAAFLTGLGVGQGAQIQDSETFMRHSGELLRALIAGLVQTMMGRAHFKGGLGLGVTIIRADQNNPFKFSANTSDLVDRLLLQPSPGYLPAVTAASEAFDDIQAHEMAMTAGLRAALQALFARFEPSRLEERLGRGSGLDRLLSSARKAKCWDLFIREYDKVAADASEDFMQLFEEAFAKAYQEQVERLHDLRRSVRS